MVGSGAAGAERTGISRRMGAARVRDHAGDGDARRLEHRHVALRPRGSPARGLSQQELLPDLARGLIASDEIEAGKPLHPTKPVAKTLTPDGVAGMLHRGGPTERDARGPALFAVGDRVRAKMIH